jgi:hypothetical protein
VIFKLPFAIAVPDKHFAVGEYEVEPGCTTRVHVRSAGYWSNFEKACRCFCMQSPEQSVSDPLDLPMFDLITRNALAVIKIFHI